MTIDEIQKAARDRIAEIDAQTAALAVEKAKLQAMLGGGTSVVEQILNGIGDGGRVDLQGPQWIPPLTIKPIPEQWVCSICKRSDCVGTHVICSGMTRRQEREILFAPRVDSSVRVAIDAHRVGLVPAQGEAYRNG